MQLSISLIIFSAILTGALHTVEVSAIPCSGTDSCHHPTFSANLNSLQRRVPGTQGNINHAFAIPAELYTNSISTHPNLELPKVLGFIAQLGLYGSVALKDVVEAVMVGENGPAMTATAAHKAVWEYVKLLRQSRLNSPPKTAREVMPALRDDLELYVYDHYTRKNIPLPPPHG